MRFLTMMALGATLLMATPSLAQNRIPRASPPPLPETTAPEEAPAPEETPAPAATGGDTVRASDPEGVVAALEDLGFSAELDTEDGTGNPLIHTEIADLFVDVFFYGCSDNADCQTMMFLCTLDFEGKADPELAAEWNKLKLYGRLIVSDRGNFSMDYVLYTGQDGISVDDLDGFIAQMESSLNDFVDFVDF